MSDEGVVIGMPGARVTLRAAGKPLSPANPDFAADFPATMTYEVGGHTGSQPIALVGTPPKYSSYNFAESLEVLLAVSSQTTKPKWSWNNRWPFLHKESYGLPSAYLLSVNGELHVEMQATDARGHIKTNVKIKPLARSSDATLSFGWDIDQSYLPTLTSDLRHEFPGL